MKNKQDEEEDKSNVYNRSVFVKEKIILRNERINIILLYRRELYYEFIWGILEVIMLYMKKHKVLVHLSKKHNTRNNTADVLHTHTFAL